MAFAIGIIMEQNDAIAYKTWVENLREPAPEGAWNAIADQLDIDAAWEGIAETLDLDDVWKNIETELPQAVTVSNPSAQTHFTKLFWAAAALVLLTLTTPLSENKPARVQTPHAQNNSEANNEVQREPKIVARTKAESVAKPEMKIADETSRKRNVSERPSTVKPVTQQRSTLTGEGYSVHNKTSDYLSVQPSSVQPLIVPVDSTTTLHEELVVNKSTPGQLLTQAPQQQIDIPALAEDVLEPDSLISVATLDQPKDSAQRNQPERAKWQIGVIGSIKNTWLINPETANGLKRSSLNDTRVTFGKEFGITLQRSMGGTADIQFEYYFYSQIGQRYHEYINALYQTKDVRLKYQKFQVVYRTRVWRNFDAPALYATGGIRISRLTLADTSIGNESQEVTQEYRPWDYGFILGGEAEFKLTDKLLLVSGLRASYGLRNIYLGTDQAPAEFNKTHTASAGLMVGIKYRIN